MDNQNNFDSRGKLESIEERIRGRLLESRDQYYNEYLNKLLDKVRHQKYQADLLEDELERSYQLYLQRNPVRMQGQFSGQDSIYQPDKTEIQQKHVEAAQNPELSFNLQKTIITDSAQEADIAVVSEIAAEAEQEPAKQVPAKQEQPEQAVSHKQFNAGQQPMMGIAGSTQNQPRYSDPQSGPLYHPIHSSWEGQQGGHTYNGYNGRQQSPKSPEVTIGAVILSIIGVGFILISFVMLGMNYMNGLVKGLSLYGISIILFLISELFLSRKNSRIGLAVTSIGIGGLYLSTVINYIHLGNLNELAAVLITSFITAFTLIYSRKKNSVFMQSAGIIICYLCILPMGAESGNKEFLLLTLILLAINILNVCIPIEGKQMASGTAHLAAQGIFAIIFIIKASFLEINEWLLMAYVISAFLSLNLIFSKLLTEGKKERSDGRKQDLVPAIVLNVLFQLIMAGLLYATANDFSSSIWIKYTGLALYAIISLLFFLVQRQHEEKWILYYLMQFTAFLLLSSGKLEMVICIFILLVISKILCRFPKAKYSDAVLTAIACLQALFIGNGPYLLVCIAGLLLSVCAMRHWTTYYEILITFTLYILAWLHLPGILRLPVMTGILFGSILLFHSVKAWQGREIRIFNYLALAGQGLCFLAMADMIYSRAYITYLMMLVFGMGTIVLTFQEKYRMDFKYKNLIMAGFLTYMALVCRLGIPFTASIFLMVIALVSVGFGFALNEKSVRIYGLVLSLFVCGKVAIYDFRGADSVQKMILFFSVGVIALIISGIYVILEKKENVQ